MRIVVVDSEAHRAELLGAANRMILALVKRVREHRRTMRQIDAQLLAACQHYDDIKTADNDDLETTVILEEGMCANG